MTTPFEIPTVPSTPQQMVVSLATKDYTMLLKWNVANQTWMLDIFDSGGTTAILLGIPLVTGIDLLDQFSYLGLGGSLVAQTDHNIDAPPTFTNLGEEGHLYYVTP